MCCCTKCGCYLPDGMVSCLACGFDNGSYPVRVGNSGGSGGHAVLTEFHANPMQAVTVPVMPLTDNSRKIARKEYLLDNGIVEIRFEEYC